MLERAIDGLKTIGTTRPAEMLATHQEKVVAGALDGQLEYLHGLQDLIEKVKEYGHEDDLAIYVTSAFRAEFLRLFGDDEEFIVPGRL